MPTKEVIDVGGVINLKKAAVMDLPEVFRALDSNENGLWDKEVVKRLITYGANSIKDKRKVSPIVELLNNFFDPLVLVLLVITLVSFCIGNLIDGSIILVMVFLSVFLNFFQEYKASKATELLQRKVAHIVSVVRYGKIDKKEAVNLVPGEVVELNAGDLVPADARLLETKDFYVNQSSLTGESFPVVKNSLCLSETPLDINSMHNIVFAGTAVNTGWARAMIVLTGKKTEFGKLAHSLNQLEDKDEFSEGIKQFSNMIIKLVTVLVIFIFGFKAIVYRDIWNSFQFAVAVAVGLTPEFLPMIMSVTMGKGSVRMAKKGVIVKKLTAIPTIGSMNVLCTDKTGTLTENKIKLIKYVDVFGQDSQEVLEWTYLNSNFQSGMTNPMDEAVLNYTKMDLTKYRKVDEIPFDFERKRLTVVVKNDTKITLITKGAPEEMWKVVSYYWHKDQTLPFSIEVKEKLINNYHDLSLAGYRVVAVAIKQNQNQAVFNKEDETEMVFVGLVAFLDPPKKGVKKALDELEALGVELKVISGDNEAVCGKICKEVDINIKGVMLGSTVDNLSDEELVETVKQTTIFARFAPEQKSRIIKLLKQSGQVVGYLGDGINDAPSLYGADVGISVANAVDIAKEAADLVLTQKNISELVEAVKEGRKTFANTLKYIQMGLSSNFGNMFSMLFAVVCLPFLPMMPLQILLNNFLYDLAQITIPTDNVDSDYIRQPKRLQVKDIKKFMWVFGSISSLFDLITFGLLYMLYKSAPAFFQTGWFMESLATQTLVIHIIRTQKTALIKSRASGWLMISTILAVAIGWVLPYTSMGAFFNLMPLPVSTVGLLLGVLVVYLLMVEIVKRWYYRKEWVFARVKW